MRCLILLTVFVFVCAVPALRAASPLQITEFTGREPSGVDDEDGDTPDWIEIQNISSEPVNLNAWTILDGLRRPEQWRFPATNLPPGSFLVIFASGKDRRAPGRPLHTNFKLGDAGGGLSLRGPAGDISKIENYPTQVAGVSFGLAGSAGGDGSRRMLLDPESELHFYFPLTDRLGTNWITPGFDDSRWRRGQNGIGYATRGNGYRELLQTDVGAMMAGRSVGLWLRFPFIVTNDLNIAGLELHAQSRRRLRCLVERPGSRPTERA